MIKDQTYLCLQGKTDRKTLNKRRTFLILSIGNANCMVLLLKKLQDVIQLKFQIHDTFKTEERIKTAFESINNEDVINQTYLGKERFKKTVTYHYLKKIAMNSKYNTTNNL